MRKNLAFACCVNMCTKFDLHILNCTVILLFDLKSCRYMQHGTRLMTPINWNTSRFKCSGTNFTCVVKDWAFHFEQHVQFTHTHKKRKHKWYVSAFDYQAQKFQVSLHTKTVKLRLTQRAQTQKVTSKWAKFVRFACFGWNQFQDERPHVRGEFSIGMWCVGKIKYTRKYGRNCTKTLNASLSIFKHNCPIAWGLWSPLCKQQVRRRKFSAGLFFSWEKTLGAGNTFCRILRHTHCCITTQFSRDTRTAALQHSSLIVNDDGIVVYQFLCVVKHAGDSVALSCYDRRSVAFHTILPASAQVHLQMLPCITSSCAEYSAKKTCPNRSCWTQPNPFKLPLPTRTAGYCWIIQTGWPV